MKVALLHYHLRPGGVTSVLREQAAVIRRTADCLILTGEEPAAADAAGMPAAVRVVRGLAYADAGPGGPGIHETETAVRRAMLDQWGGLADVLHVHNALLCRNPILLPVLRSLQERGVRLFLQEHDFAEDGRPSAYHPPGDYPTDCHYGVINSRDRRALLTAGLEARGVHTMWNVVRSRESPNEEAVEWKRPADGRMLSLLYPVRAIRRKNLGEALLLGTLLPARIVCTLPPRDPRDARRHARWKDFCRETGLMARFDAGLDSPLEALLRDADAALSTSVNEGFGFAFLEPWMSGLPVGGRRVAHVCADFEEAGIRIPGLYRSFPLPLDCFDSTAFSGRWATAIEEAYRSFGRSLDSHGRSRAWSLMTESGRIDFGSLDEQGQEEVIRQAQSDQRARRRMGGPETENLNRQLIGAQTALVEENASLIADRYNARRYEGLLSGIYRAVLDLTVKQRIDRRALLDFYLRPETFRMIEQREP